MRNHVAAFDAYDARRLAERVLSAAVRHQHPAGRTPGGDSAGSIEARAVARRTYELSEFLVDVLGVTDVGAYFPHRVTYHPTCHSLRAAAGRRTGRCGCCATVDGIELVELPDAESCCGFGGTFALKNSRRRPRPCSPTS